MSVKKNPNFYVFLGKKYMEANETIQLHALGNAISIATIAAENLVRNNYATFHEIKTTTVSVESSEEKTESRKAKMLIILNRGPDFFENMQKFNEQREKNEERKGEETKEETYVLKGSKALTPDPPEGEN